MVDELTLIDRLQRVRRIVKTNPDLADVILLGMIEETEQKVEAFESSMELFFKDTPFYDPVKEF